MTGNPLISELPTVKRVRYDGGFQLQPEQHPAKPKFYQVDLHSVDWQTR